MKRRLRRIAFSLPPSRGSIRSMTKQFSFSSNEDMRCFAFCIRGRTKLNSVPIGNGPTILEAGGLFKRTHVKESTREWSKKRHKRNIFGASGVSLKCFTSGCATVHTNGTSPVTFPPTPTPTPMPIPIPITKRILFQVSIPVQPCSKFDTFNCAWAEQVSQSLVPSKASLSVDHSWSEKYLHSKYPIDLGKKISEIGVR